MSSSSLRLVETLAGGDIADVILHLQYHRIGSALELDSIMTAMPDSGMHRIEAHAEE